MPIIQTYTPQEQLGTGRAGSAAPVSQKVDPNVGARVHQAASQVINTVETHGEQMTSSFDRARTREAYNNLREEARNKRIEFKSVKGKDAKGLGDKYTEWHSERVSDLANDLDNTIQREAFSQFASQQREVDLNALAGHEANELQQYRTSVHTSDLDHIQADVMHSFNNQDMIEGTEGEDGVRRGGIDERIQASFDETFPGLDTDAARRKAQASARSLQIILMSKDNPEGAGELLEKHKGKIGGAYPELLAKVQKAGMVKESQNLSDEIMTLFDNVADQNKAVSAMPDGDLKDLVNKRVNHKQVEKKAAIKDAEDRAADTATGQTFEIAKNGGSMDDVLDLIETLPPGKTQKEIFNLGKSLFSQQKTQTNFDKLHEAQEEITDAINDGREITGEYLLRKYKPYLSDVDYRSLENYKKSTAKSHQSAAVRSTKAQIKARFNRGDFGSVKGTKAKKMKADLLFGLEEYLELNPGKDPSGYIKSEIDLKAAEETAFALNSFFGLRKANAMKEKIASGDQDYAILNEMITAAGRNPDTFSPETLDKMLRTERFNRFKIQKLGE